LKDVSANAWPGRSVVSTAPAITGTVIALMKSRRRIAFTKAQDHANSASNYSRDLRPAKWGLGVILHGSNPMSLMSALGH